MRLMRLTILLGALLLCGLPALAQEATPESIASSDMSLTYAGRATGEISDSTPAQTWTLANVTADRIQVRVARVDGNLIPDVAILDANGQELQTSYGADRSSAVAEIADYTLPSAGDYQIRVQREGGEAGVTSGAYTIAVTPKATAPENSNNMLPVGPLTVDTAVSGEITAAQWYHRYTLDAAGADIIRIEARRVSGGLFPEIEILDQNGTTLSNGYTESTGDTAVITKAALPSAGVYTVVVTRQSRFSGDTVGQYELLVTLLGAGTGNSLLDGAAGEVVYDTALNGTINARWYEDWTLTAQAGDTISLLVTSDADLSEAGGNLQPEVILLGGSGQELRRGYTERDGITARIDRYKLDVPGTYTVRVSRAQGQSGLTVGPYSLTVTLDGTGRDNPMLNEPMGALEIGEEVTGTVTNLNWSQAWTVQGTAGEAIDILVRRTDGTLVPIVELRDANNQTIRTAYYGDSRDSALLQNYIVPSSGQYRVVVFRDGEQDGYTSGAYSLLVRPHSSE